MEVTRGEQRGFPLESKSVPSTMSEAAAKRSRSFEAALERLDPVDGATFAPRLLECLDSQGHLDFNGKPDVLEFVTANFQPGDWKELDAIAADRSHGRQRGIVRITLPDTSPAILQKVIDRGVKSLPHIGELCVVRPSPELETMLSKTQAWNSGGISVGVSWHKADPQLLHRHIPLIEGYADEPLPAEISGRTSAPRNLWAKMEGRIGQPSPEAFLDSYVGESGPTQLLGRSCFLGDEELGLLPGTILANRTMCDERCIKIYVAAGHDPTAVGILPRNVQNLELHDSIVTVREDDPGPSRFWVPKEEVPGYRSSYPPRTSQPLRKLTRGNLDENLGKRVICVQEPSRFNPPLILLEHAGDDDVVCRQDGTSNRVQLPIWDLRLPAAPPDTPFVTGEMPNMFDAIHVASETVYYWGDHPESQDLAVVCSLDDRRSEGLTKLGKGFAERRVIADSELQGLAKKTSSESSNRQSDYVEPASLFRDKKAWFYHVPKQG